MKEGDRIKIKSHYILYRFLGDKKPKQGFEIRIVQIIKPAKGTEYSGSDWVVAKPELAHDPKCWYGIGKGQIIETLTP